jgi:uncharacterized protein YecT (DUF1311 family)
MSEVKLQIVFLFAVVFAGTLPTPAYAQAQTKSSPKDIGSEVMVGVHDGLVYRAKTKNDDNDTDGDPILAAMDECMDGEGSTRGMDSCLGQAYKDYDKLLNQIYQLALAASDKPTKSALRASEKKWLAFREAEAKAQDAYWHAEPRGSVMGIAIGYQQLTAIRERIAELMMYLGADQG